MTARSRTWSFTAAALLLVGALLMVRAAVERWALAPGAGEGPDSSIEDHRYDYVVPADPWENVGAAAQLHGLALLLLAVGVLALSRSVRGRASVRGDHSLESLLVAAVALAFGMGGVHGLLSGLLGSPTVLQWAPVQWYTGIVPIAGLLVLAARWWRRSPATSVATVLLIGTTAVGYLVAAFVVAPALMGYQSYDTTPWTEAVVAAWPILAAVASVVAGLTARSQPATIMSPLRSNSTS